MKKTKGYMGGGKMKTKGMTAGGKTKTKGMMAGGKTKMKSKGMMAGGKTKMKSKGYAAGGKTDKMPMAEKDGKMVPAFLAQGGGKMPNKMRMGSKMYANGGVAKVARMEGGGSVARGSGAARPQKFTKNG